MKPIDRKLCGVGQIVEALNRAAVELGYNHVFEIFVTERVLGGQEVGQENNFAPAGRKLVLKSIIVDEALRSCFYPVGSPFLKVRARQLEEDETSKNDEARRTVHEIRFADDFRPVTGLDPHGNIESFAVAKHLERNGLARMENRICQVAESDASEVWVIVVAVLIDSVPSHGENDIPLLDASLAGRRSGHHLGNIDSAGLVKADVAAELGVSGR